MREKHGRMQHNSHRAASRLEVPITQPDDFYSDQAKGKILGKMLARLEAKHGVFTLCLAFPELTTVLGLLQLAAIHPDIAGTVKVGAWDLVYKILAVLENEEPGITSLLLRPEGGAS